MAIPWRQILTSPATFALMSAHVGYTWCFMMFLTETPAYLRAELQIDVASLLTYSSDFGAARLDPCELRTVVPYTYTLSERSAELHDFIHSYEILIIITPRGYWHSQESSPSLSLGKACGKSEALGSIAAKFSPLVTSNFEKGETRIKDVRFGTLEDKINDVCKLMTLQSDAT
ncbi:hypothetical protein EVAR_90997_1 [Eumeta japonica]|uniref:Uncharacterized protein n=1 Tax=Eumeta variegata TaxID=151549 RepID=A0A4C1Z2L4_EUMVA|nr:hypothetical protein EVAR_90997_1 [Eumeta japonica]